MEEKEHPKEKKAWKSGPSLEQVSPALDSQTQARVLKTELIPAGYRDVSSIPSSFSSRAATTQGDNDMSLLSDDEEPCNSAAITVSDSNTDAQPLTAARQEPPTGSQRSADAISVSDTSMQIEDSPRERREEWLDEGYHVSTRAVQVPIACTEREHSEAAQFRAGSTACTKHRSKLQLRQRRNHSGQPRYARSYLSLTGLEQLTRSLTRRRQPVLAREGSGA